MFQYKLIKDRKIRIGVVGCGRISKNHFDSIENYSNDLELISICDIDLS
jgi:UDP-N-acetyl-2-amino-2-deoxyglucuronate dehydrogenase